MKIRNYKSEDFQTLRDLMIIVQEAERSVEPTRQVGEQIVDKYLEFLFKENKKNKGKILIAEVNGKIAAFIAFRIEDLDFELISKPIKCLYISDIAVFEKYRRHGIAKALFEQAETYAKEKKLKFIRLSVLPKNNPARELYSRIGFREFQIEMVKELK